QGKTSILEAIYFSATGKSFRTSKNIELIKYNKEKMGSYVSYRDLISEKTLSVKIDKKNKEYKYNNKKILFDQFYGKLNIITFIPEDIELIVGSPNFRRTFFDAEIAQSNYEYFKNIKDYNKILKIRNKYLKEKKTNEIIYSIYEEEFLKLASKIILKRIEYVKNISILLNLNYRKLFDDKKELNLKYESFIGEFKGMTLRDIEKKMKEKIEEVKFQELRYGYSLVGPQRDEFKFILNGKEAKSYSSQGEKKSIIFSLKLSEIDMVIKEKKETPIFLIDDISSYFDSIRKDSIINYLKKRELQVFISSTSSLNIESKNFRIDKGEIQDGDSECQ
ncbi:MAG: DNA replication/repair protein RecF, partial [Cetobacterium sp.]